MNYRVAFWVGGSKSGAWHLTNTHLNLSVSMDVCRRITTMGMAACVVRDGADLPDGPPEWWDFENLRDKCATVPCRISYRDGAETRAYYA
jgi:hypothetical protein